MKHLAREKIFAKQLSDLFGLVSQLYKGLNGVNSPFRSGAMPYCSSSFLSLSAYSLFQNRNSFLKNSDNLTCIEKLQKVASNINHI